MSAEMDGALARVVLHGLRDGWRDDYSAQSVAEAVAAEVLASDWLAEQKREVARLVRRAINDPGSFVKRGPDYDGEPYGERLDQWQTRAIEAALTTPTRHHTAADTLAAEDRVRAEDGHIGGRL